MIQATPLSNDQIAEVYKGMLDCVTLIENMVVKKLWEDADFAVANAHGATYTVSERKSIVQKNVTHLENRLKESYWTSEDMTSVNKAVTDGKAFIA
tara:strand:+ start:21692 stop:21979 length:288 start_codon:yes stop_codon:yes gene_type:complete